MSNEEEPRGLPVYVRESIRRILLAAAHLWFAGHLSEDGPPGESTKWVSWVRARDFGLQVPSTKRIKITIEIEDDKPEVRA